MFRLCKGVDVVRADAQRNIVAVLEAAKAVFAESGVDAPVREIAARAGVGAGTLYRHFPQRSDLVVAVFRHEIDECADTAAAPAAESAPGEALARWLRRYSSLIATKRDWPRHCTPETLPSTPFPRTSISGCAPRCNRCWNPQRPPVRSVPTSWLRTICCTRWPTCACPPMPNNPAMPTAWSTYSSTDCATALLQLGQRQTE